MQNKELKTFQQTWHRMRTQAQLCQQLNNCYTLHFDYTFTPVLLWAKAVSLLLSPNRWLVHCAPTKKRSCSNSNASHWTRHVCRGLQPSAPPQVPPLHVAIFVPAAVITQAASGSKWSNMQTDHVDQEMPNGTETKHCQDLNPSNPHSQSVV
jgi:hypothetical protein